MNKDVLQVERSVYNLFTLLGDIGGLYSILISLGAFFVSYMTFNNAENFLSLHLFKGTGFDGDNFFDLDDQK